jgi:hypothetical protein
MKKILLVITSLWLTGCASLTYQEPAQGPRARVRFVTDSSAILRAYDDANCTQNEKEWMRLKNGFLFNSSPKTLMMPLQKYHKNAAKEVFVDASKPMHGMFFGAEQVGTTVYTCGVPFSFTFSENSDYEVKFEWSQNQCLAIVSQIVASGSDWTLKQVGEFNNRVTDSNRGCVDKFKMGRLY